MHLAHDQPSVPAEAQPPALGAASATVAGEVGRRSSGALGIVVVAAPLAVRLYRRAVSWRSTI